MRSQRDVVPFLCRSVDCIHRFVEQDLIFQIRVLNVPSDHRDEIRPFGPIRGHERVFATGASGAPSPKRVLPGMSGSAIAELPTTSPPMTAMYSDTLNALVFIDSPSNCLESGRVPVFCDLQGKDVAVDCPQKRTISQK